jgi:hypothetical protein
MLERQGLSEHREFEIDPVRRDLAWPMNMSTINSECEPGARPGTCVKTADEPSMDRSGKDDQATWRCFSACSVILKLNIRSAVTQYKWECMFQKIPRFCEATTELTAE